MQQGVVGWSGPAAQGPQAAQLEDEGKGEAEDPGEPEEGDPVWPAQACLLHRMRGGLHAGRAGQGNVPLPQRVGSPRPWAS